MTSGEGAGLWLQRCALTVVPEGRCVAPCVTIGSTQVAWVAKGIVLLAV